MAALRVLGYMMAVLVLASCTFPMGVVGSGHTATIEKNLEGFTKVSVGSAFAVNITSSDTYKVTITVDDNLQKYLVVAVTEDTLRIGFQPGVNLNMRNDTVRAEIAMPRLEGLELNGASRGTVTGFRSDASLALELSGASTLAGDIQAGDVQMQLSGASKATLKGSGGALRLEASGASRADLAEFPTEDTQVEVSGASSATVNVDGTLDVNASGASQVRYLGSPTLGRIEVSGASSVKQQ